MSRAQRYLWRVTFRHERQGFGRSVEVAAYDHEAAIRLAGDEIERLYVRQERKREEFAIIELKRGPFAGAES